ncbi:MAG: ribonuclease Y [Bacteroidota bacterium]|jgi:ribonuclease Y
MSEIQIIALSIVGFAVGFALAYFAGNKMAKSKIEEAEERKKLLIENAAKEAAALKKEKLLEVKEEWHKNRQEFEAETQDRRNKIKSAEHQLSQREESIENKLELITRKEKFIQQAEGTFQQREEEFKTKEQVLVQRTKQIDHSLEEQTVRLERITGMTRDDAKKYLMENMVNEAKSEAAQMVKDIRDEAKINSHKEAQKLIVQAIQRTASDHCVETTVSVVNLASEEMKGRIIGREGRNIRAFEAATGIDLIIDDTPEAVVISGFDPFRREVARVALERLMSDGRIHPARIEEVVEKAKKELEEEIIRVGESALLELNIHNMHPELIRHIGKMKYRSSYGQNLLHHSIEVGFLCGVMAVELGLDVNMAKRAGLLHDIGKCVDRNIEGPHALLGYDLAKKYREHPVICNAIGAHHEDMEMETAIAVIVQASDSISGARPGARRESVENYVKRLEKLEELANAFEGVTKTFAIQAGREVRVIVEPDRVDDLRADQIAHDLASQIENSMEYPGQIKVVVIRERRSMSLAK